MRSVDAAEMLALQVFEFIASSDEQLDRFMAVSGFDPDSLAGVVGSRAGLAGVLEYLCSDESLLLAFCEGARQPPQAPLRALSVLQRPASTGAA